MMSGGHRIILTLVVVSLLTSGQAVCPGGWRESRGSCYLFVSEPRTQAAAQTACINQGSNLTSVADEEENHFISNLSLTRCGDAACRSVWFGLVKMGELNTNPQAEGWTWLDGSTYDNGNYNKWKVGEPTGGISCARMYVKDGGAGEWGDLDCSNTFPFVCKRRATAYSTTTTTTTTTTSTPTTRTISAPTTTTTTTTPAPGKTSKTSMKNRSLGIGVGVALFVIAVVAVVVLAVVKLRKQPGKAMPAQTVASAPRDAEGSLTYSNIHTSRAASVHKVGISDGTSGDGTIPNKHMTSQSDCDPSDDYDNVPTTGKAYINVADDAAGVRDSYQHLTTPHSLTSNTDNDSYQHLTIPHSLMLDNRSSNYQEAHEPDTDRSYEALASPTEG